MMDKTFVALLALAPVMAVAASPGEIEVERAWVRAAPVPGEPLALYLTLRDRGEADRLTSVTTDAAGMAMLHETTTENGVSRMRDLASVALPAHGLVAMRPGDGPHVMLMDMTRTVKPGDTIRVTLTFDEAPPLTIPATVYPPGSSGP